MSRSAGLVMLPWMLLSVALAAPEHCPEVVDGAALLSVAGAAWGAGRGADAGAIEAARRRARRQSAGGGTGLVVSGLSEQLPGQPELLEETASASLSASLGRYGAAQRRSIDAQASVAVQELSLSRWEHTEAAIEAWLSWRTSALEAAHLEEYLAESISALAPLQQGQQQGLVTRLGLADLEVELSRIQTELRGVEASEKIARAELAGLLGGCALEAGAAPAAPDWEGLVALAARHPAVALLRAEADIAEASGLQARASTPISLQAGVSARRVGGEDVYRGPMVTLSVPLRSTGRPSATLYAAQAASLERAADWQAARFAADLDTLRAEHDALQAQRAALAQHDLLPMTERAQLAADALAASRLDVASLIRARRDLHEAEHRLIAIDLALEASALRAGLLLDLLEENADESR